jgi:hypothetical protein
MKTRKKEEMGRIILFFLPFYSKREKKTEKKERVDQRE